MSSPRYQAAAARTEPPPAVEEDVASGQATTAAASVIALATALEVAARSVAPVPFAPTAVDIGLAALLYTVAEAPAILFGGFLQRGRRLPFTVLLALGLGLVFANVGFALGIKTVLGVGIAAAGGMALGVPLLLATGARSRVALAAVALVVAAGTRLRPPRHAVASNQPSVAFVVLDTTTASHLSTYGYPRPTTPHLTDLAARSLLYRRAIAGAPWTVPSHGAMFYGRHPSRLGFQGSDADFDHDALNGTIAGDLAATGRPGVGISANPWIGGILALRDGFGSVWSVQHLAQPLAVRILERVRDRDWGYEGPGTRVTALALDWIDRLAPDRPWFLFLNYLDPHSPYSPPAAERRAFAADVDPMLGDDTRLYNSGHQRITPAIRAGLSALYDGEVASLDRALGQLFDGLAARGYGASNLLLIVVADHGEQLGEHGVVGHMIGMPDTVLHVPLLVSGPGVKPGVVETPVQTVQLRATIRELLGLDPLPDIEPALPPWGVAPAFLISEHLGELQWYWSELRQFRPDLDVEGWLGSWIAVEHDGRKAVFNDRGLGSVYDLRTDPDELDPRPLAEGRDLVAAYEDWKRAAPDNVPRPTDQTKRYLRSLGYMR